MTVFYLDPQTGERYYLNQAFSCNCVNYSPCGATAETFESLGFQMVTVDPRPNPLFYTATGPDDQGHWNATPKDLTEVQQRCVTKQVQTTQELLLATDWLLVRSVETINGREVTVPAAVLDGRNEVRTVCDNNCDLIQATTSVPELEALCADGLFPYPEVDADDYINRELVAPMPGNKEL